MALLFMDGFDAGDFSLKWSQHTSYLLTSTTTRFNSGLSLRIDQTASYWIRKSFNPVGKLFVGMAFRVGSIDNRFITFYTDNGVSAQFSLSTTAGSGFSLTWGTGGGIITVSDNDLFLINSWYYLEVSAVIDDTSGSVEVKLDGTTVILYNGDTRNGGTNTDIDSILIRGSSDTYLDDVYFCDDTGPAPYNDFLGDVRVHTLIPDAAGTSTQLTPSAGANYETVDELPYSTADYVYGTPGQKDTYSTSNLPGGTGIIYGVQTNAIVKKTDAGTISGRPVVRASGTDYPGTSVSVGTSDVTLSKIDQVNPATSTAWTSGDVNGMEIGVETI